MQAQFTPETRDDVTGWLWEGPFAALIREAIPGIAGTDLRRAREYLNACGMVVNVRAGQRGAQPQWFIRACWHQGPGGHVHVVTPARPGQAAAPAASQPVRAGHRRRRRTSRARTSRQHCSRSPGGYRSFRPTTTGCAKTMTGSAPRSRGSGP